MAGDVLPARAPLVALCLIFPRTIQRATWKIVVLSAALAVVNGSLQEVLWRGTYLTMFPGQLWLAVLYPTTGFALWHFAPQSIFPYTGPGGRVALVWKGVRGPPSAPKLAWAERSPIGAKKKAGRERDEMAAFRSLPASTRA